MIDMNKINKCLWQNDSKKTRHFDVIASFLNHTAEMANEPSFILKGGTALMVCYGLDRFSEDIDFDGIEPEPEKYINAFCKDNGYWYRVGKNTNFVKRYLIHYDEHQKPLKVEISYREKNIDLSETIIKNGVRVYTIDALFEMKSIAYYQRDRIRDLYDVVFILKHYKDEISSSNLKHFIRAATYKGIEQFDYLIATQDDGLIDKNKLANDFLDMYDSLGLMNEHKLEKLKEPEEKQDHEREL